MSLFERVHGHYIHDRRSQILSRYLADTLPQNFRILDVGCGDGLLANFISQNRPDLTLRGIDPLVRDHTYIPVNRFDGHVIPYEDGSFDGVMFVDVLHHTTDPMVLLREAARVARETIVIKDHALEGLFAGLTLRFMDKIGNARHGVSLPHNYWPHRKWLEAFDLLGLQVGIWTSHLGLYPWPASWIFERSLHFIARLDLGERSGLLR
jgi:SAM-dependent methyltransferase